MYEAILFWIIDLFTMLAFVEIFMQIGLWMFVVRFFFKNPTIAHFFYQGPCPWFFFIRGRSHIKGGGGNMFLLGARFSKKILSPLQKFLPPGHNTQDGEAEYYFGFCPLCLQREIFIRGSSERPILNFIGGICPPPQLLQHLFLYLFFIYV